MSWAVLYIAFGLVALWLLGEVLLQYKARLRWRLLAFVGFLTVVVGVVMPSVPVIALGAIGFAVGQTYVTLSFRRGFSTGWALGGKPGASKRRKSGRRAATQEPTLEVSDLEYEQDDQAEAPAPDETQALEQADFYAAEPMPDDTGQYGVYGDDPAYGTSSAAPGDYASAASGDYAAAQDGTYATAATAEDPAYATAQSGDYGMAGDGYAYDDYAGYQQQPQYDYDVAQHQYAAYVADPYTGAQGYAEPQPQHYDPYAAQQPYDQTPYPADPYAADPAGYAVDTPPGGVWVPQQRATDPGYGAELPPEQAYPYQQAHPESDYGNQPYGNGSGDYDAGYNNGQQYRY